MKNLLLFFPQTFALFQTNHFHAVSDLVTCSILLHVFAVQIVNSADNVSKFPVILYRLVQMHLSAETLVYQTMTCSLIAVTFFVMQCRDCQPSVGYRYHPT